MVVPGPTIATTSVAPARSATTAATAVAVMATGSDNDLLRAFDPMKVPSLEPLVVAAADTPPTMDTATDMVTVDAVTSATAGEGTSRELDPVGGVGAVGAVGGGGVDSVTDTSARDSSLSETAVDAGQGTVATTAVAVGPGKVAESTETLGPGAEGKSTEGGDAAVGAAVVTPVSVAATAIVSDVADVDITVVQASPLSMDM